ncbi:hypothetical protein LPJ73_001945, partial [Coemansia sp. RSA 2703]
GDRARARLRARARPPSAPRRREAAPSACGRVEGFCKELFPATRHVRPQPRPGLCQAKRQAQDYRACARTL